jgi:hypothetical protein
MMATSDLKGVPWELMYEDVLPEDRLGVACDDLVEALVGLDQWRVGRGAHRITSRARDGHGQAAV